MATNPYESPSVSESAPAPLASAGGRRVRLSVFFVNCFLLLLFPPTCCPCGFGPIGFLVQPYVILLGFPTILVGFVAPGTIQSHPVAFISAYIVNAVTVSYVMGEFAGRLFCRKRTSPPVEAECPTPPAR